MLHSLPVRDANTGYGFQHSTFTGRHYVSFRRIDLTPGLPDFGAALSAISAADFTTDNS
jgi:hypothetical protein